MPYTLVVIDMQPEFHAANHPNTIIAVTREIITAVRNSSPIVIVEYRECGPTHPAFLHILKDYKLKSRIKKPQDDGSKEVLRTLSRRKFYKNLRICGVNRDCCVKATVDGLLYSSLRSKIEVVKDACGGMNPSYDWNTFLKHDNLTLI